MSFILDALKKSESERQRQSGPALFEVKIAPPRSRFAAWGAVIGALLVVNFVAVGIVLWRGGAARSAGPAGAGTGAAAPAPAASRAAAPAVAPAPIPPPAAGPATSAGSAAGPAAPSSPNTVAAAAESSASPATDNPDDLAPAVEPRGHDSRSATGILRATESGLPTYQDAAAEQGAGIPDLKLDLHVYDAQPDRRFVFLEADAHMVKLREGDATPQGVRVERITPDGVILSYRGKEFVLLRQ